MTELGKIKLPVSEIFYSIQGEGARTGTPNIFIRIQGCKTKHACFKSGVKCDTDFESGQDMTLEEIYTWIYENANTCKWIIWTGGEPADRITDGVVEYFGNMGYSQAIETSGLFPVAADLDWVTLSPKVAGHVYKKSFPTNLVNEIKFIRHSGQAIPEPMIDAEHYFIQPHAEGDQIVPGNVKHCIELCKQNPKWRLSIQTHKLLGLL